MGAHTDRYDYAGQIGKTAPAEGLQPVVGLAVAARGVATEALDAIEEALDQVALLEVPGAEAEAGLADDAGREVRPSACGAPRDFSGCSGWMIARSSSPSSPRRVRPSLSQEVESAAANPRRAYPSTVYRDKS